MKKRVSTTRELNRVVTSFTIYKFIKDMTTPFSELKPFDQGKIDLRGKYVGDPRQVTPYYRLIINLKKLLLKIPDPTIKAKLKYLTSAIALFVEETEHHGADPDIVFDGVADFLMEHGLNIDTALDELLLEDGIITNSISGGGVDAVRGNPDETIIHQMAYLKKMNRVKKRWTTKSLYIPINNKED